MEVEDVRDLPHQVVWRLHRGRLWRCWEWTGNKPHSTGYAYVGVGKKKFRAHRYAWFLVHGVWPTHDLNHLCENRLCINVKHLEDVTRRVNTMYSDTPAARNAAKTHCRRGHSYPPSQPGVKRYCTKCMALRYQEEHKR